MIAAQVLAAARAVGVTVQVKGSKLTLAASQEPPAALIQELQAHKGEVVELLRGDLCRHCGQRLAWPDPVGVVHDDGTASCFSCYYEAAAERALAGAVSTSEHGEILTAGDEP